MIENDRTAGAGQKHSKRIQIPPSTDIIVQQTSVILKMTQRKAPCRNPRQKRTIVKIAQVPKILRRAEKVGWQIGMKM